MPSSGPSLTEIADTDVLDKYAQRMPAQSAAQRAGQNYGDSGGGRDRAPSGGYRRMNSYGDEPDMEPHRRAVARDLDYDDGEGWWCVGIFCDLTLVLGPRR
jgi:hypothetical protein